MPVKHLDHAVAYGQAETVARGKTFYGLFLDIIEHAVAVEYTLAVFLGYTFASIVHRHNQVFVFDTRLDFYTATFRSVFERIGNKIVENLAKRTEIGIPAHIGLYVGYEIDIVALGQIGESSNGIGAEFADIYRTYFQYLMTGFNTTEIDQFLYKGIETLDIGAHKADVLSDIIVGAFVRHYALAGSVDKG